MQCIYTSTPEHAAALLRARSSFHSTATLASIKTETTDPNERISKAFKISVSHHDTFRKRNETAILRWKPILGGVSRPQVVRVTDSTAPQRSVHCPSWSFCFCLSRTWVELKLSARLILAASAAGKCSSCATRSSQPSRSSSSFAANGAHVDRVGSI